MIYEIKKKNNFILFQLFYIFIKILSLIFLIEIIYKIKIFFLIS
jgi:hypothetical protein